MTAAASICAPTSRAATRRQTRANIAYYHDEDKNYLLADSSENFLQDFAEKLKANRYQTNKHETVELKKEG